MVFATIPVIKPHQPEKVSRVSNAAAKYHGLAFNDKLLSGRHLLQKLTGIIFGFREQQIALLANKEAIFYKLLSQAMTTDVYRRPRAKTEAFECATSFSQSELLKRQMKPEKN